MNGAAQSGMQTLLATFYPTECRATASPGCRIGLLYGVEGTMTSAQLLSMQWQADSILMILSVPALVAAAATAKNGTWPLAGTRRRVVPLFCYSARKGACLTSFYSNQKFRRNTGNIIRLCANTGFRLPYIIEPMMGFTLGRQTSASRRDWIIMNFAVVRHHHDYAAFLESREAAGVFALTTKGTPAHSAVSYQAGDYLMFAWKPAPAVRSRMPCPPSRKIRIPMMPDSRSMNLSNAVSVVVYEARRQRWVSGRHSRS